MLDWCEPCGCGHSRKACDECRAVSRRDTEFSPNCGGNGDQLKEYTELLHIPLLEGGVTRPIGVNGDGLAPLVPQGIEGDGIIISYFGFSGSAFTPLSNDQHAVVKRKGAYHEFSTMDSLLFSPFSASIGDYDGVADICGGAGDTGALLIRRGYRKGQMLTL